MHIYKNINVLYVFLKLRFSTSLHLRNNCGYFILHGQFTVNLNTPVCSSTLLSY